MKTEQRALMRAPELRAGDSGKTAVGYAVVFDSRADIGGWFIERFMPGAFRNSLGGDIRALVNHDSSRLIGRSTNGTMRLAEDDHGLKVEIDLPDTSDGRDVATLIERGDMSGMSFQFAAVREEWDETSDPPVRTVYEAELYEAGPVTFPAYEATQIAMRSSEAVAEARQHGRRRHNADRARQRIALRKAEQDHKFRGIRPASRD